MLRQIFSTFVFLLFIFMGTTDAQEQRFKAGIILGANLAQIDGDNSNGYIKLGITGGIRGVTIISEKVEISMELLFDQKGSRSQKIFDENFFPFSITNNYVTVPVLFNYQDWLDESEEFYKLHFHTGFSYGRLLSTTIDDKDAMSIFKTVSEHFNEDDVSILVGVTFYTGKHLAVTGRFSRALTALYKYDENDPNGGPPTLRPFRSKFLTMQLLYMF